RPGEYQVQAAIAALHDQAASHAQTDWAQILALYDRLEQLTGNPMVTLNRAVATAMVHGPGAGLALLDGLGGRRRAPPPPRAAPAPPPGPAGGPTRAPAPVPAPPAGAPNPPQR